MAALQALGSMNLLYWSVMILFDFLILSMIIRMLLSFLASMLSPANPFVRFFTNITGPLFDPINRLLPRISLGIFDVSSMIAFIFVFWALSMAQILALSAFPPGW
jgi:uncharacterized protein YggT (Ycf19 family)